MDASVYLDFKVPCTKCGKKPAIAVLSFNWDTGNNRRGDMVEVYLCADCVDSGMTVKEAIEVGQKDALKWEQEHR